MERQLVRFYEFGDVQGARDYLLRVQGECEVRQVCDPAKGPYRCHMEPWPIPPFLMDSVSVDHFAMPEVTHEGVPYDSMQICVDRLSGWIVAVPMSTREDMTA